MSQTIRIEELAEVIEEQLEEYAAVTAETLKTAVQHAGNTAKAAIKDTAPKNTGKYAKSWRTKKTQESADSIQVTVYSPSRYQIAHLLEHGHAKRGGGRVRAIPHIAPAEELAEEQLMAELGRSL